MSTISIKLKIRADKSIKDRLVASHKVFNENVKRFEEFLLLARGKDYYFRDSTGEEHYKSAEEVRGELKNYLHKRGIVDHCDLCMDILAGLESVIASKGSQAAGMLAKLYQADSNAGMNNISKIVDPVPEWMTHFHNGEFESSEYRKEADCWIESEEGKKAVDPILNGSGRPSSFKLAYSAGKEWYSQFVKDQEKYRKDLEDGLSNILFKLDKINACPLIDINQQLLDEFPVWVRLMLKTALENFASYIACDKETRSNYLLAVERYENIKKRVYEEYGQQYSDIECFLAENQIETDRSNYLTRRMCRGMDDILFAWKSCSSYQERINVLNQKQTDEKSKITIGDINYFRWLAEDDHIYITKGDCIDVLLDYYQCLRDKEIKKKCASYTLADPITSKRYLFYEGEKGTNYRKYKMVVNNGIINISLPVLLRENNKYLEEIIEFTVAGSKQFRNVEQLGEGKIHFSNDKLLVPLGRSISENEEFIGKLGGADLRVETTDTGRLTGLFMSFTITIENKYVDEAWKLANDAMYCFSRAYDGKRSKYDQLIAGKTIRALSIDMGLKQFCAAVVGEIEYGNDLISLPDIKFDRMFLLKLPGEKTSSVVENCRREAFKELRQIRSEINYISLLKRIYNQANDGRKRILERSIIYYKNTDKLMVLQYCLNNDDKQKVDECLSSEYSRIVNILNQQMKNIRAGEITKRQERNYKPGKSYWSISYLEELRKLIIAWNSLGYHISDDNKLMARSYGVTATRLLEHIQNLKDDRIKTGADLIIQAARGYCYDDHLKCWVQKYDPCNIVIFEDLSRYNFKLDRPSRENSKLMKWAHREIVEETKRQASIYGIAVYDSTDAAYSSKYCYKTGAPGIRCDRLKKDDFEFNGSLKSNVAERLPNVLKNKIGALKTGDIIPSDIGSIFVTIDDNGKLFYINADMNAAANLQKRFFGLHTHLLRLNTINKDGYLYLKGSEDSDKTEGVGKRNNGKLIYHFGTTQMMLTSSDTPGHFKLIKKQKRIQPPQIGKEYTYNLFRDPSGYFYPKEEWIGYKEYWSGVEDVIAQKLAELI